MGPTRLLLYTNDIPCCHENKIANEDTCLGMTFEAKLSWKSHFLKKKEEVKARYRQMRREEFTAHRRKQVTNLQADYEAQTVLGLCQRNNNESYTYIRFRLGHILVGSAMEDTAE